MWAPRFWKFQRKSLVSVALLFLPVVAIAGICLGCMQSQNIGVSTRKNTITVQGLFGRDAPEGGIFPSDLFTVPDDAQNTGLRVKLPLPDCDVHVSDCLDIALINL